MKSIKKELLFGLCIASLGISAWSGQSYHKSVTSHTFSPKNPKPFTILPTASTSTNWGGYETDASYVSEADGRFIARKSSGGFLQTAVDASWVGVGGSLGQNLAQTGIDMNKMQAWYELYPANPVFLYNVSGPQNINSSSASVLCKITENCPNGGKIIPSSIGSDGRSFSCSSN